MLTHFHNFSIFITMIKTILKVTFYKLHICHKINATSIFIINIQLDLYSLDVLKNEAIFFADTFEGCAADALNGTLKRCVLPLSYRWTLLFSLLEYLHTMRNLLWKFELKWFSCFGGVKKETHTQWHPIYVYVWLSIICTLKNNCFKGQSSEIKKTYLA